jgi:hypothetical protein
MTATETVNPVAVTTETPTTAKVNRSKLIIEAFKESRRLDTPANEIVEAVKKTEGVEVTVSLVNNIRKRLKDARKERKEAVKNGEKRKPGRPRKEKTTEPTPATPVSDLDRLVEVKKFANSVGGMDALKNFISKLDLLA